MHEMKRRQAGPSSKSNNPKIKQLSLPGVPSRIENPWRTGHRFTNFGFPKCENRFSTLELCAGGGGQALGFEQAGFDHAALVEIDRSACATLRTNRTSWNVVQADLREFDASAFGGIDVVSGGLPCPPFSIAGKQLGPRDERNLFPVLINLADQVRPAAIMIENVRGILDPIFDDYRLTVERELKKLGFQSGWKLLNACDFGVPQLRPRVVFIALRSHLADHFAWPNDSGVPCRTVGDVLADLVAARGWKGAKTWVRRASGIAPTIVGGSLKHGGPDLGPTRARAAWATLGVDGLGIADEPPAQDFHGMPRLTVRMVARLQGFPDDWEFVGTKTQKYRQVGNAFPPPLARSVAMSLRSTLEAAQTRKSVAV